MDIEHKIKHLLNKSYSTIQVDDLYLYAQEDGTYIVYRKQHQGKVTVVARDLLFEEALNTIDELTKQTDLKF